MLADLYRVRAIAKFRHEVFVGFKDGAPQLELASEEEVGNLILDGGRVAIHTYVYGTPAQRSSAGLSGTGFNYIALTNDGAAPAAGDTVLASELVGNGLTRAVGVVTLPTGSGAITTIVKAFTYTNATPQAVQKTALFDAAAAGRMAHEIQFSPRTLNLNDVFTVTFSITAT